jgi:hypothetical protein
MKKKSQATTTQLIVLTLFCAVLGFEALYMVDSVSTWWQILRRAIHRLDLSDLAGIF